MQTLNWFWLLGIIFSLAGVIAYRRTPLWAWTLSVGVVLVYAVVSKVIPPDTLAVFWGTWLLTILFLHVPPVRRNLLSRPVKSLFQRLMPPISTTEKEALEAGTAWWDKELFSGRPDWRVLDGLPGSGLSGEEQVFLDGPVEELCGMVSEWQIARSGLDMPQEAWDFLKKKGFFGMIIPKRYGGLEFSARAHSAVIVKLASRSVTAAVTAMVPNSLGPGQLLLRYGTDAQKDHYLPKLASGEEVPCFALTSHLAGSDAASMRDTGVVCRGDFGGEKDVLGIRLNWQKRYITLAPVATLLGLAFKLYDPEHLLGDAEELGITLALIPTDIPGVEVGRRHYVLDQGFQNGPTSGRDVFVPLDFIIGGRDYAGKGWKMLMECLAEGRGVSLPALSAGLGKLSVRATTAYSRVRKQFNQPIGRFEGVEEALVRVIGNTYAIEAVRRMTVGAVDAGERPSVVSAIAKYHCTERMRRVVNDAMDVFGGTAICLGPLNLLGSYYESVPISITVEGANILTRSLIIFGQGMVRCHPFLLAEMEAVTNPDNKQGLKDFDRALFGHLGFTMSNLVRSFMLAVTGEWLSTVPLRGVGKKHGRRIARMSSALALLADMALVVLGGDLKRREKLSARLGDVLSQLYIASAALEYFKDQGAHQEDVALLEWVCRDALYKAQERLADFLRNFPNRLLAGLLTALIFPLGRRYAPPGDRQGKQVAALFLTSSSARERLTAGIFVPEKDGDPLGRVEHAFNKAIAAGVAENKVRKALKAGVIAAIDEEDGIAQASDAGVIDAAETAALREAHEAMLAAVKVDEFESLP